MAIAAEDPRIEIVSADSMQVYRGMDIGTAKPTLAEQKAVRHHLIDVVDPHEDFGVSRFQAEARAAIADIESRGGRPLLVGGTGLYIRAVVDDLDIPARYLDVRAELDTDPNTEALHAKLAELDPVGAGRMEKTNRRRVLRALEVTLGSGRPFSSFGPGMEKYPVSRWRQFGVDRDRETLYGRIHRRYDQQIEAGFLAEVRSIGSAAAGMSTTARQALGYKELLAHIANELSFEEAMDLARQRTRRFARRQQRWFRRDPRILWLDGAEDALALARYVLNLSEPHSDEVHNQSDADQKGPE